WMKIATSSEAIEVMAIMSQSSKLATDAQILLVDPTAANYSTVAIELPRVARILEKSQHLTRFEMHVASGILDCRSGSPGRVASPSMATQMTSQVKRFHFGGTVWLAGSHERNYRSRLRTAGTPAYKPFGSQLLVTTDPAAITHPEPM